MRDFLQCCKTGEAAASPFYSGRIQRFCNGPRGPAFGWKPRTRALAGLVGA